MVSIALFPSITSALSTVILLAQVQSAFALKKLVTGQVSLRPEVVLHAHFICLGTCIVWQHAHSVQNCVHGINLRVAHGRM